MTETTPPEFRPTSETTLKEAKRYVLSNAQEGVECPCCTQSVRVYRRNISTEMALALIEVTKSCGTLLHTGEYPWFHAPTFPNLARLGGNFSKLVYWGLIEEAPSRVKLDGGRAGWWRLTHDGVRFTKYGQCVPKWVYLFDGRLLKLDGPPVCMKDCLGSKHNLRELLGS